jgi:uncharacterized protein
MIIIDAHLHTNFQEEDLQYAASQSHVNFSTQGLIAEMAKNHVDGAIAIRSNLITMATQSCDDLGCQLDLPRLAKNIYDVAYINPYLDQSLQLNRIEQLMKQKTIVALKIYLGYYHFYPSDKLYKPFYALAEKFNLPIIFHTGDTYSKTAKLKFSRPIEIDEVAVDHPKVKFVMAHLGAPWVLEAAEIIYKNENVYADLSGWISGTNLVDVPIDSIKEALRYCNYRNLMYGSDWPLVDMHTYIQYIDQLIPSEYKPDIFTNTAKALYHLELP